MTVYMSIGCIGLIKLVIKSNSKSKSKVIMFLSCIS
jgi:hypothetical protein